MADKLTEKQERFCLAWHSGKSKSDAYREAYETTKMKPETVNNEAAKLSNDPGITARMNELRQISAERAQITVEKVTDMLLEDRQLGYTLGNPGAAVSASMGVAKLHGLITDKLDATVKGDIAAKLSRARETLKDSEDHQ